MRVETEFWNEKHPLVKKKLATPDLYVFCGKAQPEYDRAVVGNCVGCEFFMGMLDTSDPKEKREEMILNGLRLICNYPVTYRMERLKVRADDGDK